MRPRATTLVAASQVAFVVLLGICVALEPHRVVSRNEGGVSNYGVHLATLVPYYLAFALDAGLLARAAALLGDPNTRRLRRVLRTLAVLLAATLLSTIDYTHSAWLTHLHDGVGALLVLYECAVVAWLSRVARARALGSALAYVTFAGLALCVLASTGVWHVLFVGQVLVTAGLAPLLILATWRATTSDAPPAPR